MGSRLRSTATTTTTTAATLARSLARRQLRQPSPLTRLRLLALERSSSAVCAFGSSIRFVARKRFRFFR
jgi:hypothetical protein